MFSGIKGQHVGRRRLVHQSGFYQRNLLEDLLQEIVIDNCGLVWQSSPQDKMSGKAGLPGVEDNTHKQNFFFLRETSVFLSFPPFTNFIRPTQLMGNNVH